MKLVQTCRRPMCCLLVIFFLFGCHPSPRSLTLVSGKTVYGAMALEDVHIEIFRWEQTRWRYFSDTRSGYHGSFRIHLPGGTYRFTASKTIRMGQDEVSVTGKLEKFKIDGSSRRIDQVVIELTSGRGN
jgi:hypothetical protein